MKTILPGDHPTLETVAGRSGEIIIVGEKAIMMRLTVQPNVPTPSHSHPHEQMGILLEGEGTLYIGDEVKKIGQGTSFYVPPDTPHNFDATGEKPAILMECFSPPREDYMKQVGLK